jgi:hypothetical protein
MIGHDCMGDAHAMMVLNMTALGVTLKAEWGWVMSDADT